MTDTKDDLVREFRRRLLAWGARHRDVYPWRQTDDPYAVLVAEFMLHRTQARQVEPVYRRFMERFPTLEAAAGARDEEIREILTPLGLYWRREGMVRALRELQERYRAVPVDEEALRRVHGIGPYIAGATVCFTQNRPLPLIDSNTVRVVGRVLGLDLRGEARRRTRIRQALERVCDPERPRDFYLSLIDLAHQVCLPKAPLCDRCPLLTLPCRYGQEHLAGSQDTASGVARSPSEGAQIATDERNSNDS